MSRPFFLLVCENEAPCVIATPLGIHNALLYALRLVVFALEHMARFLNAPFMFDVCGCSLLLNLLGFFEEPSPTISFSAERPAAEPECHSPKETSAGVVGDPNYTWPIEL